MNFLEQLAAEWYEYSGYFVRTNVRAKKRSRGGWDKELDVIAYKPSSGELIHIETSGAAESLSQRIDMFNKKFELEDSDYREILHAKFNEIKRIVIAGWSIKPKTRLELNKNVEVILIPEFFNVIIKGIHEHDFMSAAVPESYPLLRTIQMMDKYQDLSQKDQKK